MSLKIDCSTRRGVEPCCVCDWCSERIHDVRDGVALYRPIHVGYGSNQKFASVFHTHARCSEHFKMKFSNPGEDAFTSCQLEKHIIEMVASIQYRPDYNPVEDTLEMAVEIHRLEYKK